MIKIKEQSSVIQMEAVFSSGYCHTSVKEKELSVVKSVEDIKLAVFENNST